MKPAIKKIRIYILFFLITLGLSTLFFYNLFITQLTLKIKDDLKQHHQSIQTYINSTLNNSTNSYFKALGDRLIIDIENLDFNEILQLPSTYNFNDSGFIYITNNDGVILSHPEEAQIGKSNINKEWIVKSGLDSGFKYYKNKEKYNNIYKVYSPIHNINIIFECPISDFISNGSILELEEYIQEIAKKSYLYIFIISEDYNFVVEPIVAPQMPIIDIIPNFKVKDNYFTEIKNKNKLDVSIGYFSQNNIYNWTIAITGTSKHVTANKTYFKNVILKSIHPVILFILLILLLFSKLITELKLKNKSLEIIKTQKELLCKLGEVIETRSKETNEHVQRVAALSDYIAYKYGMNISERKILRTAAPLHDIGKIGIEDSILNKTGKLTPDEYDCMKQHTVVGYNLLKGSEEPLLKAAAIIAYEHHEDWNGKGYPLGKTGANIHIYARIVHIADVIDALLSERTYKEAWPKERVYSFIMSKNRIMFDPDLTIIVLNNFDKIINIFDSIRY